MGSTPVFDHYGVYLTRQPRISNVHLPDGVTLQNTNRFFDPKKHFSVTSSSPSYCSQAHLLSLCLPRPLGLEASPKVEGEVCGGQGARRVRIHS